MGRTKDFSGRSVVAFGDDCQLPLFNGGRVFDKPPRPTAAAPAEEPAEEATAAPSDAPSDAPAAAPSAAAPAAAAGERVHVPLSDALVQRVLTAFESFPGFLNKRFEQERLLPSLPPGTNACSTRRGDRDCVRRGHEAAQCAGRGHGGVAVVGGLRRGQGVRRPVVRAPRRVRARAEEAQIPRRAPGATRETRVDRHGQGSGGGEVRARDDPAGARVGAQHPQVAGRHGWAGEVEPFYLLDIGETEIGAGLS